MSEDGLFQATFDFGPALGTLWRGLGGALWRVVSRDRVFITLHRADLPGSWNNQNGEALGASIRRDNFAATFTAAPGRRKP
jgi:hypothetical protein